jgi:predicted amidophosphoribosyltransferase
MFCPNCGNKLDDGAKFCGFCGTPAPRKRELSAESGKTAEKPDIAEAEKTVLQTEEIKDTVYQETAAQTDESVAVGQKSCEKERICPNCGRSVGCNAEYCGNCGAPINDDKTVVSSAEQIITPVSAETAPETELTGNNETACGGDIHTDVSAKEEGDKKTDTVADENVLFCPHCGSKLTAGAKFCGVCGNAVTIAPPSPEFESKKASFHAPILRGENAFGQVDVNKSENAHLTPGQVISNSFRSLISSLTAFFKDPIKLIPLIILAVLWLTINILQACGVNFLPINVFSFLSFAEAGMHGGILGALGGIIGKGMFAGAAVSLVRLFTQKNAEKRSFADIIKGAFGVSPNTLWTYLTGIGAAMLLYLFISGGATRISFMGGIAAAFLAARAALNNGFLKNLLGSLTKSKSPSNPNVQGLIRGLSVGFAVSALIGLLNINLILIITGSVLLVGGIVMMILQATGVVKIGKGAQQRL